MLGHRSAKYSRPDAEDIPIINVTRSGKRKKKRSIENAKVIVQTSTLTQSKARAPPALPNARQMRPTQRARLPWQDMAVNSCKNGDELIYRILEEFSHMVQGLRPSQTALLCKTTIAEQADQDDEPEDELGEEAAGGDQWLLVVAESDFAMVLTHCNTFKLIEQKRAKARLRHRLAFASAEAEPLRLTHKKKCKGENRKAPRRAARKLPGGSREAPRGSQEAPRRHPGAVVASFWTPRDLVI